MTDRETPEASRDERAASDARERSEPGDDAPEGSGDGADGESAVADVTIDLTGTPDGDAVPSFPGASSDGDDGDDGDAEAVEDDVEPVELLVQLAERGEIDPWDIDVVTVTEEFLAALDEGDLRAGGRALFYASVLLRMKSDALMEDDEPAEADEFEAPWEMAPGEAPDEEWAGDPFDALEAEMERRIERKRARGMPRTLDELVRELRDAERDSFWKDSRTYDTSDSPRGYARGTQTLDYHAADDVRADHEPTVEDVTGTAHDEDMESTIGHVYRALREQYDRGRDEVLFAEVEAEGGSRVETFLACLFLAHRGQIRLRQDDLFGDLWLQDPGGGAVGDEAVAD